MIKMLPRFSPRANGHNVLFAIISDAAKKNNRSALQKSKEMNDKN